MFIFLLTDSVAITVFPKTQTVLLGSPFVITCNATGNPTPRIEWRRNGTVYNGRENVNITVQSFNNGLTFSNIAVSAADQGDSGSYECVANALRVVSSNATVIVTNEGTYTANHMCNTERYSTL